MRSNLALIFIFCFPLLALFHSVAHADFQCADLTELNDEQKIFCQQTKAALLELQQLKLQEMSLPDSKKTAASALTVDEIDRLFQNLKVFTFSDIKLQTLLNSKEVHLQKLAFLNFLIGESFPSSNYQTITHLPALKYVLNPQSTCQPTADANKSGANNPLILAEGAGTRGGGVSCSGDGDSPP